MASKGQIGGFSGQWGKGQPNTDKKYALLRKEGVKFDDNGCVAAESMFYFGATQTKMAKKTKQSPVKASSKVSRQGATSFLLEKKISNDTIKQEILKILQRRAPGKTC